MTRSMKKKDKRTIVLIMLTWAILLNLLIPIGYAEEEQIQIICTNSILADFTSNILTDNCTIEYIMPAGVCPAHFDTVPSDVLKIVNADIIISLGWEPWLESLLNKSGNTEYTEIKCLGLGEWNIPSGALSHIKTISDGLKTALPEKSAIIQQNTKQYMEKINATALTLQNQIEILNLTNRKIVSMEWQKDFLEWLGLNITYYYSPPEGLSVQDEIDVITAASQDDVAAVVDNLQSGTDFGARVAGESGVSHVIFSNFPKAVPNTDTYLDMISYNTNQLIKGITSHDYTDQQTIELQNQFESMTLQRNTLAVTTIIAVLICAILFIMYKKK